MDHADNSNKRSFNGRLLVGFSLVVSQIIAYTMVLLGTGIVHAAPVLQVSTGDNSTCAVVDYTAKCWGDNTNGELGTGTAGGTKTSPVSVANNATAIPAGPNVCSGWGPFQTCNPSTPAVPASPLGNKDVTKVSVGTNHACALANADVFCWGDNSHGQLGNRSTTSSATPVAVDKKVAYSVTTPAHQNCTWIFCTTVPASTTNYPGSALIRKEIVDITAGDNFTCALASDGTVACWGYGANGRLGTGTTSDVNVPQAIYSAAGTPFAGKKGVKLAKASGATMCVLATDGTTAAAVSGQPYCWGYGIDDGTGLPANKSTSVACGASSPTSKPGATTETTIFQSAKPVLIPGGTVVDMDGGNYVTGLSTSGRANYWGMYGYVGTSSASNITSCSIRHCTGMASTIRLARYNHSTGGNTTGSHNQQNSAGQNVGGGGSSTCTTTTHYGYTKNTVYSFTGQKVEATPPAWSSSQSGFTALSGDVVDGLYCATTGGVTSCDAHGTSSAEGQTGSGFTPHCTTSGFIFTTTTCTPGPTGPQAVKTDGWLAGKTISSLDTGAGYTCAITSDGMLGCWGVNAKGQLGNGTTVNKNVPTKVEL